MNRLSPLVRIGRGFQRAYQCCGWLDYIMLPFFPAREESPNYIFLLAPPRSGSTVTYQLLCSSIESTNLSNTWNLLYSTPLLGGAISNLICKNRLTTYKSEHGLVAGLCGEAEGLAFWRYWTGALLAEEQCDFNEGRTRVLIDRISRLKARTQCESFIAGFLGHVFMIEEYRKVFDKSLFIHLVRDPISNAASLYEIRPHLSDTIFSTLPMECDRPYRSRQDEIADQVYFIHKKILEHSLPQDTMHITYEAMCKNPAATVDSIITSANRRGFNIRRRDDSTIPNSFPFKVIDESYDHYRTFKMLFEERDTYALLDDIGYLTGTDHSYIDASK